MAFIREDQADIRVSVDGVLYGDSWASAEGANLEADDSKTRPGGMGREVSAGGPASRDDLTVETQFTDAVAAFHRRLEGRVGNGRVNVSIAWMTPERTPTGTSLIVTGTLKRAATPDMNSEESGVGRYQVVVSCDELSVSG